MSRYEIAICGNVGQCRTEAEICLPGSFDPIATVFETTGGWHTQVHDRGSAKKLGEALDRAVAEARAELGDYVNRLGENPPEGLSVAGLSFWLMEKSDGTAMGQPISG